MLRLVVLKERGTPDGRSTKTGDVVQIVYYTLDVTAMTAEELFTGIFVCRIICRVIRSVAVSKAVRHDQIYHIRRSEALALCRAFLAGCDFVRIFEGLAILAEYDIICARACVCRDLHIHKQIVGAVCLVDLFHADASAAFDGYIIFRNILSLDQKLERHFHTCPP